MIVLRYLALAELIVVNLTAWFYVYLSATDTGNPLSDTILMIAFPVAIITTIAQFGVSVKTKKRRSQ